MSASMEIERPARGWRYWAPRIATSILVPLVLLAITEGALQLFGVVAGGGAALDRAGDGHLSRKSNSEQP